MENLKKFNEYLADLSIWTMKLHNLHWNVRGTQFMSIHLFTEKEYKKSFERIDELAEHIKMFGYFPVSSYKEQLEISHLEEEKARSFQDIEALRIIKRDMNILKEIAIKLRKICDEQSWFNAVSLFEAHIKDYNKQLWFISSILEE